MVMLFLLLQSRFLFIFVLYTTNICLFVDNTASHLIIGGGVMGQSLAYNLWRQIEKASPLKAYKSSDTTGIVIVEKDPTVGNE